MNTATIINQFVKEIKETIIESECFDNEYMNEKFEENETSIIGLLHLSDGELNEMYAFKSPKAGKGAIDYGYWEEI